MGYTNSESVTLVDETYNFSEKLETVFQTPKYSEKRGESEIEVNASFSSNHFFPHYLSLLHFFLLGCGNLGRMFRLGTYEIAQPRSLLDFSSELSAVTVGA